MPAKKSQTKLVLIYVIFFNAFSLFLLLLYSFIISIFSSALKRKIYKSQSCINLSNTQNPLRTLRATKFFILRLELSFPATVPGSRGLYCYKCNLSFTFYVSRPGYFTEQKVAFVLYSSRDMRETTTCSGMKINKCKRIDEQKSKKSV